MSVFATSIVLFSPRTSNIAVPSACRLKFPSVLVSEAAIVLTTFFVKALDLEYVEATVIWSVEITEDP